MYLYKILYRVSTKLQKKQWKKFKGKIAAKYGGPRKLKN